MPISLLQKITALVLETLLHELYHAKTKAKRGYVIADFVTSVVELTDTNDSIKTALATQLYQDLKPKPCRPGNPLRDAIDAHHLEVAVEDRQRAGQRPARFNKARALMEVNPDISYHEAEKRIRKALRPTR